MSKESWGRYEVVLAGTGGQGLVFLGNLLGEAAVMGSDLYATVTQSYGIASRGGFSKAEVVLSTDPVAYPRAKSPDLVLALSSEALQRYRDRLPAKAQLIYDTGSVDLDPGPGRIGLPLSRAAREAGLEGSLNVMALGALVEIMDLLPPQKVTWALSHPPGPQADANLRAFEVGRKLGKRSGER